MKSRFQQILREYGQTIRLRRRSEETERACRGFLQAIGGRDDRLPVATPLGAVSVKRWLLLSEEETAPGDRVAHGEQVMVVLESRAVSIADELIYWRAILCPEREAAA